MPERRGRLIAALLTHAWRAAPLPSVALTPEELAEVAPALLGTGGAALGWWRIRGSDLRGVSAAHDLRQVYRLHAVRAAVSECHIAGLFTLLRSRSIEPLLVKGWAEIGRAHV